MIIGDKGNYRLIDTSRWHVWFPWIPIRITEGGYSVRGGWRWLYKVERKVGNRCSEPRTPIRWQYRDIGERWFECELQYA